MCDLVRFFKSAMKIGGEYRMRDIRPRQWRKLAKNLRLDSDNLLVRILDFARRTPDVIADLGGVVEHDGLHQPLIERLMSRVTERARRGGKSIEADMISRSVTLTQP